MHFCHSHGNLYLTGIPVKYKTNFNQTIIRNELHIRGYDLVCIKRFCHRLGSKEYILKNRPKQ
jgi:hypothetical protein